MISDEPGALSPQRQEESMEIVQEHDHNNELSNEPRASSPHHEEPMEVVEENRSNNDQLLNPHTDPNQETEPMSLRVESQSPQARGSVGERRDLNAAAFVLTYIVVLPFLLMMLTIWSAFLPAYFVLYMCFNRQGNQDQERDDVRLEVTTPANHCQIDSDHSVDSGSE